MRWERRITFLNAVSGPPGLVRLLKRQGVFGLRPFPAPRPVGSRLAGFWPARRLLLHREMSTKPAKQTKRPPEGLPAAVQSTDGLTAVRLTPHPIAAMLCRMAGTPLVATSANVSGNPPAWRPEQIDPYLLKEADYALLSQPWPTGGLPSTLVKIVGPNRLKLLRPGPLSVDQLQGRLFIVE